MYQEFLSNLKNKYGYDENLLKAIEICIPVIIDTYGEGSLNDLLKMLEDVRIFATSDVSKDNRQKIKSSMLNGLNPHIEIEDTDAYVSDSGTGSFYRYEPVYDENMNIKGEVRFIVTMVIDNEKSEGYQNLFGTTINVPYLLHELNHAFAMRKSTYKKVGDKIEFKHGMFIEEYRISTSGSGKIKLDCVSQEDIMLEEIINEIIDQRQLMKMLRKSSIKEVNDALSKIGHIPSNYGVTLMSLGENFEKLIGFDRLVSYRIDNNLDVKREFNFLASQSDIASKYFPSEEPWDFFSKKYYEIYELDYKKYHMSMEEYIEAFNGILVDVYAPLQAYKHIKYNITNLEDYERGRTNILGEGLEAETSNKSMN